MIALLAQEYGRGLHCAVFQLSPMIALHSSVLQNVTMIAMYCIVLDHTCLITLYWFTVQFFNAMIADIAV